MSDLTAGIDRPPISSLTVRSLAPLFPMKMLLTAESPTFNCWYSKSVSTTITGGSTPTPDRTISYTGISGSLLVRVKVVVNAPAADGAKVTVTA